MRDATAPTKTSDLVDRLDTAILRAGAIHQAQCMALESGLDAFPDGVHHHLAMAVETPLPDLHAHRERPVRVLRHDADATRGSVAVLHALSCDVQVLARDVDPVTADLLAEPSTPMFAAPPDAADEATGDEEDVGDGAYAPGHDDATTGRYRRALSLQTVAELLAQPRPKWIVRGILPRGALGVVFGEPGSGKTFLGIDLAAAIARGQPWFGHRTKQGALVYDAWKGTLRNRIEAFLLRNELRDIPGLYLHNSAINLLDPMADAVPLIEALHDLAATAGPVALVIVDTLNRALAGGNENAPEDMGALISNAKRIQEATGAAVVFVHHGGKDASRGSRGHSSLKRAADMELAVAVAVAVTVGEAGNRAFAAVKAKDGESGSTVGFGLLPVDLGPSSDPDTEPDERESSCVVVPADVPPARATRKPARRNVALEALREAIGEHGETMPGTSTIPKGVKAAPRRSASHCRK